MSWEVLQGGPLDGREVLEEWAATPIVQPVVDNSVPLDTYYVDWHMDETRTVHRGDAHIPSDAILTATFGQARYVPVGLYEHKYVGTFWGCSDHQCVTCPIVTDAP